MPGLEKFGPPLSYAQQLVVSQHARRGPAILARLQRERIVEFLGGPARPRCALRVERSHHLLHEQRVGGERGRDTALTGVVDFPTAGDDTEEALRNLQL